MHDRCSLERTCHSDAAETPLRVSQLVGELVRAGLLAALEALYGLELCGDAQYHEHLAAVDAAVAAAGDRATHGVYVWWAPLVGVGVDECGTSLIESIVVMEIMDV
jgi:hypothetical protein